MDTYMLYREQFIEIYDNFVETSLYRSMMNTTENNSYHMERNVAEHTQLVLSSYISRIVGDWTRDNYITAIALLFHDAGKPSCRQTKTINGTSREVFHGHEQASMVLFMDYAFTIPAFIDKTMIYQIAWIIENHLPYSIKSNKHLASIQCTVHQIYENPIEYRHMLMADRAGRVSKDFLTGIQSSTKWLDNLYSVKPNPLPARYSNSPELTILMGMPSTGKTSYAMHSGATTLLSYDLFNYRNNNHQLMNMIDYDLPQSIKDAFYADFITHVRLKEDITIDSHNLSSKHYYKFVSAVRSAGYKTKCVLFLASNRDIVERCGLRNDKHYQDHTRVAAWSKFSLPSYYEFDTIEIL